MVRKRLRFAVAYDCAGPIGLPLETNRICGVKMRILYLHQYFSTRAGTAPTRSYEFARHLVRKGHGVTMATGLTGRNKIGDWAETSAGLIKRGTVDGIEVVVLRIGYSNEMSYLRRMVSFTMFMLLAIWAGLGVHNVDIVFATSTPLTIGIPGYVISRLRKVPFIFEIRDLWPAAPIAVGALRNRMVIGIAKWLEGFLYRSASRVIVLSPDARDVLVQQGVSPEKLRFIPNCSDLDLFKPEVASDFRTEHELDDRFVCLYMGAMGISNGLDIIMRTAELLRDDSEVMFVLIGEGREKAGLIAMKERLQLGNVLFPDPRPRSEMPGVVAAADLCLLIFKPLKIFETTSPNKLFDYLAAGRPVLTNLGGWIGELLERSGAGVAVGSQDASKMAEMITWLKDSQDVLHRMGISARELAVAQFDRARLASEFEEALFESMVSSRA